MEEWTCPLMYLHTALLSAMVEKGRGNNDEFRSFTVADAVSPANTCPRSNVPSAGSMVKLGDTPSPDRTAQELTVTAANNRRHQQYYH